MILTSYATSTSSALLTGEQFVHSVVLVGGSSASSVVIYDNTAASGTKKIELNVLANDSKPLTFGDGNYVKFSTGAYTSLSGLGARVYVYVK